MKIHRLLQIELLIQPFQLLHSAAGTVQRGGIDKVIVTPLYGQIVRLQPIQIHKTHILRVILAHLINSKTISLMDLAAAAHREEREKKKSVMEQLKSQPKAEHKKTAPKKSAEREI